MRGLSSAARSRKGQTGRWFRLRRQSGHGTPFDRLVAAACEGDPDAQMSLGMEYLEGRSVPASTEAAAGWFTRAAENGHAGAMVQLARLALAGDVPQQGSPALFAATPQGPRWEQARHWAQRACAAGSEEGAAVLAAVLNHGPAERQDGPAARALLERAAGKGNASAAFSLAIHHAQERSADPHTIATLLQAGAGGGLNAASYLLGIATEVGFGCGRDVAAAVALYRRAAERGFVWAQARLGHALLEGVGTPPNHFEGETWLRTAARAGNAPAAALLGDWYARVSETTDYLEAGHWFLRAAELGDAPSARVASFFHLTGTGLHEDRRDGAECLQRAETLAASATAAGPDTDPAHIIVGDRADLCRGIAVREWFAPLAGSGDHRAAYRLGVCFAMGIGGGQDQARAVEWLSRAAEHIPAAQLLHGQLLLYGDHKRRDPAAGRSCIHRAAQSGHSEARVAFGEVLLNGRGGAPDRDTALALFTEAAERGHRGAMYAMGALHGGGHGRAPDLPLAQRWFRRAAECGHGRAQMMLGRYLAHGVAGERDDAAAATWLRRALRNGVGEADGDLAALAWIG